MTPMLNHLLSHYSAFCCAMIHSHLVPSRGEVIASLEGTVKSEDLHRVGIIHQLRHRNNVAGYGQEPTRTRRGREVRKPACYYLAVEGLISHGEGRCKGVDHEIKRSHGENDHESSHAVKR